MDYWRRAARISRKDKIRNSYIKEKMQVQYSILDFIKKKQLNWYGHIRRMEEGRLPKIIMDWEPQGRKKKGRPNITWIQGINETKREWEIEEDIWMNRQEWKNVLKQMCS